MAEHKGVSIWQKIKGGVWYLHWRDPRNEKKKRNDSSDTTDFDIATRIALSLSRLINNADFWTEPPDEIHPQAEKIWGATPLSIRIAKTRMRVIGEQFLRTAKTDDSPLSNGPARDNSAATANEVDNLLTLLKTMAAERDQYRDECRRLTGLMEKMGNKVLTESEPKSFKDATEQFFKERQNPNGWTKILRNWIERLGREYGENKNVHDLTAEFLIKHIERIGGTATAPKLQPGTRLKLTNNLCMFLTDVSKGFDEQTVKARIIGTLEEVDEEWNWLTPKQALGIIAELKKQPDGEYWSDLAALQYAGGFRGEEMAILQTSNAKQIDGKWQVGIAPIFDTDKRRVRRVKTTKSKDSIRIPSFAVQALERRINAGGFLLFPMYDKNLVRIGLQEAQTAFERKHALWPSADDGGFSAAYTERLRAAAALADSTLEIKTIGARTMRKTCARELILKYGYEAAAAVLRDSVDTLRKHYADLEASDVSTER